MIPRAIRGPAILKKYIFGSGGMSENLKLLSIIRKGIKTIRLKKNLKKRSMETGTSGPRIFTSTVITANINAENNPNNIPICRFCGDGKILILYGK